MCTQIRREFTGCVRGVRHGFLEIAMCQLAVNTGQWCQGPMLQVGSGNINTRSAIKCTVCNNVTYICLGFQAAPNTY